MPSLQLIKSLVVRKGQMLQI